MKRNIKTLLLLILTVLMLALPLASCSSAGSVSDIPWENYDKLIEKIRSETDPAKKEAYLHVAEDMLMNTECIVPLYELSDAHLIKNTLTGVYTTEFGARYFTKVQNTAASDARLIFCEAPDSLDPAFASNVTALTLVVNTFAGLYSYDAEGNVVPDLAESVTVSEDGLTYTFKIKSGLSWSSSASMHLGASDFIFSWRRVADPETKSPYAYLFDIIAEDEDGKMMLYADESDTVLSVTLKSPCDYFLELCAFPAFFPVNETAVEYAKGYKDLYGNIIDPSAWSKQPNYSVSGAYVISSMADDGTYVLTPNPHYPPVLSLRGISVTFKSNVQEAYDTYAKGEADFIGSIPGGKLTLTPTDAADATVETVKFSHISGTYMLCHNFNSKIYRGMSAENAALLRRAISLYIDRDNIISSILGGYGRVATSVIGDGVSDGSGGVYRKNTGYHRYPYMKTLGYISEVTEENRAEAREILKTLGLDSDGDGRIDAQYAFSMNYLTLKKSDDILIAQSIQQDLAEIGIVIKINAVDERDFSDEQKLFIYDIVSTEMTAYYNDALSVLEHFITDGDHNFASLGAVVVEEDKNAY